jgi:hypothetical protein
MISSIGSAETSEPVCGAFESCELDHVLNEMVQPIALLDDDLQQFSDLSR